MITISLCMIVKNEEDTLERCLSSVHDLVDEIIIIDTGSTDQTKEIAKKFTNRIYDFEWCDDFSKARNFSFSFATKDYILWLDADDFLKEHNRQQFQVLKNTLDSQVDVVLMKYEMSSNVDGSIRSTFMRERLLKRSKNFKWQDPIHEYIDFKGKFQKSDVTITHQKIHAITRRNLDIFEKYIASGHDLSERNWFYYAKELFITGNLDQAIEYYEKFLNTKDGLISNYIDSCIDLATCYKVKGDSEKQLDALMKSFKFAAPRAEIICQIGYFYKDQEKYEEAIKWFEIAPLIPVPQNTMSSVNHEAWGYVPYMELVSCYYRLGDVNQAIRYNEEAANFKADDDKIVHNRVFLAQVKEALVKRQKENK